MRLSLAEIELLMTQLELTLDLDEEYEALLQRLGDERDRLIINQRGR